MKGWIPQRSIDSLWHHLRPAGNTPGRFKETMQIAKDRLEPRPATSQVLTIHSWNEWTEGSGIESDTKNGTQYLQAIHDIFGAAK